jgi:hypothetical protein
MRRNRTLRAIRFQHSDLPILLEASQVISMFVAGPVAERLGFRTSIMGARDAGGNGRRGVLQVAEG